MTDFPPSIVAGKLTERTSEKGNVYLTGYFGSMRITALKTKDVDDRGQPIWTLRFAEAPQRDRASGDKPTGTVAKAQAKGTPAEDAGSFSRPVEKSKPFSRSSQQLDDEIPF